MRILFRCGPAIENELLRPVSVNEMPKARRPL
jgi:hypothetical protein